MRTEAEILRAQKLIYDFLEDLKRAPDRDVGVAMTEVVMAGFCDTLSWVLGQGAWFQSLVEKLEAAKVAPQQEKT